MDCPKNSARNQRPLRDFGRVGTQFCLKSTSVCKFWVGWSAVAWGSLTIRLGIDDLLAVSGALEGPLNSAARNRRPSPFSTCWAGGSSGACDGRVGAMGWLQNLGMDDFFFGALERWRVRILLEISDHLGICGVLKRQRVERPQNSARS